MRVQFNKLSMQHFKSQEVFAVEFGPITRISGRNGAGKSSTGEAISWLFFGVDMMGSKLDPRPLTASQEDITSVELLLTVEQEDQNQLQMLFGKKIVKGKAQYFVNEVPEKAGHFDQVVNQLFDKNMFLSIFNPVYFPSQPWKDQREQLLKFIEEPFTSEVLDQISKPGKAALEERLKKNNLEALVKINGPKYKDGALQLERAGERYVTYKEQLEKAQGDIEGQDLERLEKQLNKYQQQLNEIQGNNKQAQELDSKRERTKYTLTQMRDQLDQIKGQVEAKQKERLQDHCRVCEQPLNAEALKAVEENKQKEVAALMAGGKQKADEYRALFEEWKALPEPMETLNAVDLNNKINEIKTILAANERMAELAGMVEAAQAAKEEIKKQYLEAQEILEAAKEYETTKAELMVQKVDSLFNKLTVKLFEEFQNGNSKPTFEIEYQDKPYAKLSTAERIKAGLEMVEALSEQANKCLPVFIDNAESIIIFKQPKGQLITATVKNSQLVVKQEGANINE